jgi:DNA-binding transcriptional MerR regulator
MDKSPDAFRTISEVAGDLDLPQHVLRFWETRFNQIRPLKRGGGRRYYRPDDIDLLKGIRHLLYREGYTIKGVQRILRAEGVRFVQGVGRGEEFVEVPPPAHAEEAGYEDDNADGAGHAVMAEETIQRLRGALEELRECDRVLGNLKTGDPTAGNE